MKNPSPAILLFFLFSLASARAQVFETKHHYVSGTVVNDSTKSHIGFVHIFNESKRIGAIADKQGRYKFRADVGDTIVFGALGYFYKVLIISDSMLLNGTDVLLSPRYFEIEEVDIVSFGSYENFKKKFIALEAHKTKTRDLRDHLFITAQKEAQKGIGEEEVRRAIIGQPGTEPMNGIPILYKEDLQRLNYARVLKLEEKQRIIHKKYNFQIVQEVTKLPDEDIVDFMSFCNFTMQYLLKASEYEILVRIEKKYEEYLKKKPKGELQQKVNCDSGFYS
jgi:hypothetical protein